MLLAELQRINSHLVWLGTHGMEVGAVSVMLYCFRERELLLNINEMLAGFRLFPSYMRVGGLREDLPRGFHDAVRAFLDRFPAEAGRVRGPADEERDLPASARGASARISKEDVRRATAWSGPIARAAGVDYDVRKAFPVPRLRDLRLRRAGRHRRRRLRALSGARRRDARERQDLPAGARAHHADRRRSRDDPPTVTPPPKDRVYTEMEALIQHFLIYSQGFTVPAGEAYVPVEGPRGEQGFYVVSDGTNRPWRVKSRAPSLLACQALER